MSRRTTTAPTSGRRRATFAAGLATAAAAALVLTGCSAGSNSGGSSAGGDVTGTITLQTWALTPKFTGYLKGVIAAFEKKHPGTTVKLVDQPGDGYSDKVLSQASSNTLPDVVNLPPDIALPLAKRGILEDVSKADSSLRSTYTAGSVDAYDYKETKGGVYGYPWYLNTDVDFWNKSMLDQCGLDSSKPPATTQQLFAQAKTMHEHCPNDYLMSRKPTLSDFTLAGVKVLNSDGTKFTFATKKAASLIDQYATAYQNGYMPSSVLNSDYLGNSTLFTQGKVAWTTGGASSLSDFETNNPSLKNDVVVSPALDTPPLYVQGLSVSQKSKHLATANAFAQFMTNAANQKAFAKLVNIFPSTKSSQSDPFFSKDDGTENGKARVLANTALKTAKNLTPVEANDSMTTFLDQQIALAMKGQTTSMKALQTAQTKMNTLLTNG
ncbi:sugar ABC transporter substrate-binding protein [Curtobacterium sp. MCBD17_040]|uniref:ABC transporter substrate-binding protein n=1 Tax=Curtobacterium sp. MCBD17_040 TaxID=2175674 RepID=UPI000DA735E9|nr:sugar ABC transporter substrate-binding protein [Curtobacterium sp. MCBD17_040]WIB63192.1 sugar ABC transporter substrate-binding protein [Curtobacterium sp. MCBD17_040]